MSSNIETLIQTIKQLRAPGGCPWDIEQTPNSITPHIIEEAYELVDAININDPKKIIDELSDYLLHIIMLCEMYHNTNGLTLDQVADHCNKKMIRRHPHVFDKKRINNSNDVIDQWDQIKLKENPMDSILDNLPLGLSPLLKSEKIQKKVGKEGFEWPDKEGPLLKLVEECNELTEAINIKKANHDIEDEIGDILFTIVNILRINNKSAETILHKNNQKFINRFKQLEKILKQHQTSISECSFDELNAFWDQSKKLID